MKEKKHFPLTVFFFNVWSETTEYDDQQNIRGKHDFKTCGYTCKIVGHWNDRNEEKIRRWHENNHLLALVLGKNLKWKKEKIGEKTEW